MKKSANLIRWVGVTVFGIMAVYALSEQGFLGALLFLLGGMIIAPLDFVQKIRGKLKLNKAISVVLAVILLFGGTLVTPTTEISNDNNGVKIIETVSDGNSEIDKTTDISKPSTSEIVYKTEENSSEEKCDSKSESPSKLPAYSVGTGQSGAVNLSDIPAYSGKAFIAINNNIPNFSADELKMTGYEKYSELDNLGRTQVAIASVGKDTMPKNNEERDSICSIKPTGWHQAKYEEISGGWLYNRCHLIGWQLSAENANRKNLITGTKYLNISGMLPFENMVADYIKETGNHVAYRITPIYDGNNLLASGVQMEAYSVEDNGAGICFNVFCYNVQPNIKINYATGASSGPQGPKEENTTKKPETQGTVCLHSETTIRNKKTATTSSEGYTGDTYCKSCGEKTAVGKVIPKIEDNAQQETDSQTVYITETGKKYHSRESCSGLNNAKAIYDSTISEAKNRGLTPCSKCW